MDYFERNFRDQSIGLTIGAVVLAIAAVVKWLFG